MTHQTICLIHAQELTRFHSTGTRAAKAKALANPGKQLLSRVRKPSTYGSSVAWASEIPNASKSRFPKRKKQDDGNSSFPEDGVTDHESDHASMPKRGSKRVKKAVFADEEEEEDEIDKIDEIEIDESGSHPLTSKPGGPSPSPQELATHEDPASTSTPTSATQDEMPTTKESQSSKAQKGIS